MSLLFDAMSEEEWVDTLLAWGKQGGWLGTHFRAAKTNKGYRTPLQGDKGYVDITFSHVVLKRTLFVEAKSAKGVLRPEQKLWRDALLASGEEWFLWKPKDREEARQILLGHMPERKVQWG